MNNFNISYEKKFNIVAQNKIYNKYNDHKLLNALEQIGLGHKVKMVAQ